MGTNYYAKVNPCSECGKPKDKIHLGKSSSGWKFTFRDQEQYDDFKEFKEFILQDDVKLEDEYGEEIKPYNLISKIKSKQDLKSNITDAEDCRTVNGYEFIDNDFV